MYKGRIRTTVAYDDVEISSDEKSLLLHWVYINDQIDMEKLIDTVALLRSKPFERGKKWSAKELQARIVKSQSSMTLD